MGSGPYKISLPAQPEGELAFLFIKIKTSACNRHLFSMSLVAGTCNCWDAEVGPSAAALERSQCVGEAGRYANDLFASPTIL